MIAGSGGTALGLPMIWRRRRKPVSGSLYISDYSRLSKATLGRRVNPDLSGVDLIDRYARMVLIWLAKCALSQQGVIFPILCTNPRFFSGW